LQRLAANTGRVDPRLLVQWPKVGRPLWDIFNSLGRPPSMGGASAISQQEIQAWQHNHSTRLTPWELEMIQVFDRIAIATFSKQDSK
jgi:hypothetical protein